MFQRENFISLFDRLTALAEKLPKSLSQPILKELKPIQEIFLHQRPARLVLLGEATGTVPEILESWCNIYPTISSVGEGWRNYTLPDRGNLQILDGRQNASETSFEKGISSQQPDVVVFFASSSITSGDFSRLKACSVPQGVQGIHCPILLLHPKELQDFTLPAEFGHHEVRIVSPSATAATLCELLPNSAKLEMARVLKAKAAQRHIANTLLHAFAAICGIVGMQPLPLADLPILTSLQSCMVGIIAYCGGRRMGAKSVAEFVGAVGLNIGLGMAFREGARTVARFVPFWGSAVSGFVAGAGTYAIGKAAIAYFIDKSPTQPGILSKHLKNRALLH